MIESTRSSFRRTGQYGEATQRRSLGATVSLLLMFLVAFFAGSTATAHAQLTTGDIVGTVTDATGAVIPNATVVVTNTGTSEKRTVTTSGSGAYQVTLLPVGKYSVTVTAAGFKTSTTNNLSLEAGDRAPADVHLVTGGATETVSVEATTALLQADSATVSTTVTAQAVQDLPLNGRNFVQLVQIVPGANEGPGNGLTSGGRPDDRRSSSSFSVNGQDDTLNNYTIDGIDDNERVIGSIGVKPSVESIEEISIQTNSYAAEAGRTAGGVINIVTRQGTNKYHGTVYEYFRNDIFDGKNFTQQPGARKAELRQNQFGASLSGPIFRDRTFFFGDYEGFRQVSGVTYKSTVPTLAEYNNIHSLNGGSPAQQVAKGNGTAGKAIDPIALKYLQLFPAPNVADTTATTNNYIISPNKTQISNSYDARLDHKFNDRNLLFARFSYNKVDTVTPAALGTQGGFQISGGRYIFAGPATDKAQQYVLGYTHIFNQSLIMDLRAAYTRINNLSLPLNNGTNPDTALGFGSNMNFNNLSSFLTPIQFGPFSDIGDGAYVPLQDIDGTYQYAGTLSYTKGNHNIKFGVSFIRRQARNVQSAFAAGQYTFGLTTDNCVPGTGYDQGFNACSLVTPGGTQRNNASNLQKQDANLASSLVGAFSADSRNYDLTPPDYRSYEPSAFLQDSWKASSKLTVLYGVRYDLFTPFTEAHNRISNFDYNQALTLTAATVGSALKVAGVNGVDARAGIKTDYKNFAPRVGFAYSVNPLTVVRGGYGISFFPNNYTSNADLKNAPFVSVFSPNCVSSLAYQIETGAGESASNIGGNGDCASVAGAPTTFDQGLPLPAAQNINSSSLSFVAEDPNFKSALIQQFNLQVERQFGPNVLTIGYVGNIGQHLGETINDINVPKPFDSGKSGTNPATGLAYGARPLSPLLGNLSNVGWLQSEGVSNYNALQASIQRRFSKGLSYDANYTWGKALSDVTGFSQEGAQGWSNADPTRIRQIEYGIAENDIQNRFALSVAYEVQYGKNFTGLKKLALAGYHFNTITVWQSGKPFSILNGGGNYDGSNGNRATPFNNGGSDRPNQILSDARGSRSNKNFFNTGAFCGALYAAGANPLAPSASCSLAQSQQLGTVGTTHRNSLFGPHYRHVDLSMFKDFAVTERLNLQFRAEAFNISNTPDWIIAQGSGNVQLGNSDFGTVTAQEPLYQPRQFQFALKAQF